MGASGVDPVAGLFIAPAYRICRLTLAASLHFLVRIAASRSPALVGAPPSITCDYRSHAAPMRTPKTVGITRQANHTWMIS